MMNCKRKEAASWLFTSVVILEMACIGLISLQKVTAETEPDEKCVPVCDTKECVLLANLVLKNIDPTADPCTDVTKFMCGGYEEKFAKGGGRSTFIDAGIKMDLILNSIIRDIKADPDTAVGKMKIVYDSCMDYASLERNALPTATKFLDEIGIPNWPYLSSDFQFQDIDVPSVLGKLKAQGERLFIMPYFRQEPGDKHFSFFKRLVGFSRDSEDDYENVNPGVRFDIRFFYEFQHPFSKESIVYILNYFELNSEEIERIWKDYSDVRKSILKLKDGNCKQHELHCEAEPSDYDWLLMMLKDETCSSEITINCSNQDGNWTDMCKAVEVFLSISDPEGNVDKDPLIIGPIGIEGYGHFLQNIFPVLKSFSDRTVANFLALNFYLHHLEELNFYFQLTTEKYSRKSCDLSDMFKKPTESRWKYCTKWIAENMMHALQFALKDNYLAVKELKKISDIFEECKSDAREVASRLEGLLEYSERSWYDIDFLKLNFDQLKIFISHPKMYKRVVNKYFQQFQPQPKNFLHNVLELGRTISDNYKRAFEIIELFQSPRFEVQALESAGSVVLQFGILQPPYYMYGLQRSLNRFLLASTLNHEIGHYLYNFVSEEVAKECLTNQFSKFQLEISNETLNGSQYAFENFADLVSTQMMDNLIERYAATEEAVLLPGLPYSFEQFLYMVISMHWCIISTEGSELRFKEDSHAPDNFRMIGKIQNSRVYPKAFNCLEDTYLNPKQKCSVMSEDS